MYITANTANITRTTSKQKILYIVTIYNIVNMTQLLTKRIPVSDARWKELGNIKQAGQTYDELLADMIVAYNRNKLKESAIFAKKGKGTWHTLDDI